MDGLMLDTEKPMIGAWVAAGRIMGLNITEELAVRTIGLSDNETFKFIAGELGVDLDFGELKKLIFRLFDEEFARGIDHKPGLLNILNHLASLKIPMAVATSTHRELAVRKLEIAGISDFFACLAAGDEVAHSKPAPDIFLMAAEKLGVPARDCIGFEDSPAGLQALAAAGIHSVFIKDLVEPPREILETVWKRLGSLNEAIELF